MPKSKAIKKILLFALILFILPLKYTESASIANIDIKNTGKRLVLFASLEDGFPENIVEAVNSGVSIGITYTVVLKRKRPFFFDKKLFKRTIKKYVKYDTLKEEYKLITDIGGKRTFTKNTDDLNEVVRNMTSLESIPLISAKKLKKKNKYYAMVKAQLNSKRTWFPFDYILFFIPFLNFDTSWENSSSFTVK